MSKYVYLFTAENSAGQVSVFQAEDVYFVEPGDLIMYGGELFTVRKINHAAVDGDDYAMIADVTQIRDAEEIYTRRWRKAEEADDEDS